MEVFNEKNSNNSKTFNLDPVVTGAKNSVKNLDCPDPISYFFNAKEIFKNAKIDFISTSEKFFISISQKPDKLIVQHSSTFFEELNKLTDSELKFTNMLINNILFFENKQPDYLKIKIIPNNKLDKNDLIETNKSEFLKYLGNEKQNLEKIKNILSELQDAYSDHSEKYLNDLKNKLSSYKFLLRDLNKQDQNKQESLDDCEKILNKYTERNYWLKELNNEINIGKISGVLTDTNDYQISMNKKTRMYLHIINA